MITEFLCAFLLYSFKIFLNFILIFFIFFRIVKVFPITKSSPCSSQKYSRRLRNSRYTSAKNEASSTAYTTKRLYLDDENDDDDDDDEDDDSDYELKSTVNILGNEELYVRTSRGVVPRRTLKPNTPYSSDSEELLPSDTG